MSGIKGKNSRPEMLVRKMLFAMGYRFRLHRHDLPGTPDVIMSGWRIAIFIHGCFWHVHKECKYARIPSSRKEFWETKLQRNVNRDQRAVEDLTRMGWRVLNIWECSTRTPEAISNLPQALRQWIISDEDFGEISAQSLATSRSPNPVVSHQ